jgi:hypothetical protein
MVRRTHLHDGAENAIDPEAHGAPIAARLEMDVTRPAPHGLVQDQVGQLHDRGGVELLGGDGLGLGVLDQKDLVGHIRTDASYQALDQAIGRIQLVDYSQDCRRRCDLEDSLACGNEAQRLLEVQIARIGHRHRDLPVVGADRDGDVAPGHLFRDQRDRRGRGRLQIGYAQAVPGRDVHGEILLDQPARPGYLAPGFW